MTLAWNHPFTSIIAGPTSCAPIRFFEGQPNLNEIAPEANAPARIIIIDDFMRESSHKVVDIFTKGSHHRNLSVMFITQNIFHQSKGSRDMSLNAHYIVMFKNPRDKSQIFHFSRQVYTENPKFLQETITEATCKPHSYLLFDMKQMTPEAFRFRTDIFPNESNAVYVLRNGEKLKQNVTSKPTMDNLDTEKKTVLNDKKSNEYDIPLVENNDFGSLAMADDIVQSMGRNQILSRKAKFLLHLLSRSFIISWDDSGR
ncbi:hypothetical protein B566_EDAN011077, partial [Ephemera danica]